MQTAWGAKRLCLFVGCGDVSMGKASASVQTPAPKQTPAGHGGPPTISAMGRKKQGLLDRQARRTDTPAIQCALDRVAGECVLTSRQN